MRYSRQYIQLPIAGPQTVAAYLNTYADEHPDARLVTVILFPRNPGQPDTYEAIWEYGASADRRGANG